jgi:hypothetical protein
MYRYSKAYKLMGLTYLDKKHMMAAQDIVKLFPELK